jgi:hypothetical protein
LALYPQMNAEGSGRDSQDGSPAAGAGPLTRV